MSSRDSGSFHSEGRMTTPPDATPAMSSLAVLRLRATTISAVSRRAMKPSLLTRIENQVGRPWMLDGKMFLPLTGMPILKRARRRVLLAVWLPEPLTVAATMVKLLTPAGLSSMSVGSTLRWTLVALMRPLNLSARERARRARCGSASARDENGIKRDAFPRVTHLLL